VEALILPRGARARNARVGAAFGIVTGILIIIAFLFRAPPGPAATQLSNFNAGAWELAGILNALILLAAVPFAAYIRSVLEGKSPGTASAGAILFIIGATFGSVVGVLQASEMNSLAASYITGSAPDRAAALLAASLFNDIAGSILTVVLIAAGIVLFSASMFNSRIFANWVADVGIASAVVLTVAIGLMPFVSSTGIVAFLFILVYFVLTAIWVFASSAYLARAARPAPVGAPTPAQNA
jgi:hypothetical protein